MSQCKTVSYWLLFSRLNPQPIADSFTLRHLSRLSTFLLEQRACPSTSGLEIFYHGRLHEVARGPWLTGYTSFIHTPYFNQFMLHLDTLCHIAFYFLSVVRTNYLSIFEQGKVKPSASSPRTTPENKHFSFNNIFKIFVTFSSAFVKVLEFAIMPLMLP